METKDKVKNANKQPQELNEDELEQVTGGVSGGIVTFEIDAPTVEEVDIVELNIVN